MPRLRATAVVHHCDAFLRAKEEDLMTTMTQHAAGMFCWCQIGTTDPEAAKKFYGQLFGWGYEDSDMDGQTFTVIKKNGKDVGGLYGLMKEQRDRHVPPN